MLNRYVGGSLDLFVDTILLGDNGIQIDLFRKVKQSTSSSGLVTSTLQIFATIPDAFITREGMDITENAISGRDIDFEYLSPITYWVENQAVTHLGSR